MREPELVGNEVYSVVVKIVVGSAVIEVGGTDMVRVMVASGEVKAVVGSGEVRAVVATGEVRVVVASREVRAVIGSGVIEIGGIDIIRVVVVSGEVKSVVGCGEVRAVVGSVEVRIVVTSREVWVVVGSGVVGDSGLIEFGVVRVVMGSLVGFRLLDNVVDSMAVGNVEESGICLFWNMVCLLVNSSVRGKEGI